MYKKAWCTCRAAVLPIQTFFTLPFSLPSPSSLLKLPSSLNSDAVHSRHFQLSFPTFTWYEGDCNGTWANHEVLHLTYHKSDIGISVLEQPYLRTRHGEPELTQPRSKPQQRIKSQMTWKFFSPERGGVSPRGRTPIWSYMKAAGVLVIPLWGVNFGFWSHLGCSGQNTIIFSRKGLC